ncbi:MAG: glycosyltransferase [Dehalococcoidales bacterium]|nr:glycosyltransferase [Dehalococcoidales bacterium]
MDSDRLKIAMLSAHSCPVGDLGALDTGGMSVYIRELAGELSRQGHTVDVYTRVHNASDPIIVELGERARLIHLKAGDEEQVHKLAVYTLLPEFTCQLENFRKDNDLEYDIVFSHYWLSGWVGDYLRRWWSVPHAIMFHTLGALKNASGSGHDASELRIVTERDVIHTCQRIIVATEREKDEIGEYYGAPRDNIGVVPCGVNMELFQPVDKSAARRKLGVNDETILLFVGRIDPVKGVDRLLKAVPNVRSGKKVRLLVIGGDDTSRHETDKLKQLAAELGITDAVDFRGMVKQEELPDYYSAADVCVLPSYYESFGLVALESLACGTPVVASDVGDLKNIIVPGKTGYVMDDNSPESLAEGISRTLAAPGLETPASIRSSVQSFSWDSIAGGIVGELRYVLEKQQELIG